MGTSVASFLTKSLLKPGLNQGEKKIHQFQSKLHFIPMNEIPGRLCRNPDFGKLKGFSWRRQAWPSRACPATPARYRRTYFPWNTEAGDTRTSSAKITSFGSSGGCSASLRQTQELSDANPQFPGVIKAHTKSYISFTSNKAEHYYYYYYTRKPSHFSNFFSLFLFSKNMFLSYSYSTYVYYY